MGSDASIGFKGLRSTMSKRISSKANLHDQLKLYHKIPGG